MAEFRISGNVYKKVNENIFLTTNDRVDFKNRYCTRNDFTTKIKFPKEFFKENFKFDRSAGIYRTSLKYRDILYYIIVETTDSRSLRVRAFNDKTYSTSFVNYGVIKTVRNKDYIIQPFIHEVVLGEGVAITSEDIRYNS